MKKINTYLKYNYRALLRFLGVIILFVLFILFLLGLIYVHQYNSNPYIDNAETYWEYVWGFMLNNTPIFGVLGGFLGIFLGFLLLGARFSVVPYLLWSNTNRLKVSVCNTMFLTSITDVTLEVDYIKEENDGRDRTTKKIEMNKTNVTRLKGSLCGSADSIYTFHSAQGFVWNDNYDKIRCRVTAANGISGVKRTRDCVFSRDKLKRGMLQDGLFISQVDMYAAPGQKTWIPEIGRMCNFLQTICEHISLAIEPVGMGKKEDMIGRIDAAIEDIKTLKNEEAKNKFPCLKLNDDTIASLLDFLNDLRKFYTVKQNLNPDNKEGRQKLTDKISKYTVFLGDQMDKDVNDMYKELYKQALEEKK